MFVRLGYRKRVESTKKKSKHRGHSDTLKELGKKWQMDVKYVPTVCYVGTDVEKCYQYIQSRMLFTLPALSFVSHLNFNANARLLYRAGR